MAPDTPPELAVPKEETVEAAWPAVQGLESKQGEPAVVEGDSADATAREHVEEPTSEVAPTASHGADGEASSESPAGSAAGQAVGSDQPSAVPEPVAPSEDQRRPAPLPATANPTTTTEANASATLPKDRDAAGKVAGPAAVRDVPDRAPERELSPSMLQLRDRIRGCLSYFYQRPEDASKRSPWGIMHGLITFGVDTDVIADGRRVNAIALLCANRPCRNMKLLEVKDGELRVRNGPGYQGHEGQFLHMLALSKVKSDYPIRVDGHEFTVADLIEYEKKTCRAGSELTFKLVALSHYLDSDATWTCDRGETWNIPRLIREELAQPIVGAACGGTHRLIGYSAAVNVREKRGEPVDGEYLRAKKYVRAYHEYGFKLQNRDGSFSTSWFAKPDNSGDLNRKLQTTGHFLEWLAFSLPDDELTDPRVLKTVNFVLTSLTKYRQQDWEVGHLGHAVRGLALYNERVFGDKPGERRALLARRPGM
ncbi:MAG: hypothetical protein FJ276_03620 [Planctomycetes bacterium]|nr:hypothetical protein [Planctomycetota bacterium]